MIYNDIEKPVPAPTQSEKKVNKVVTGVVKKKKPSKISRFASLLVADDVENVKDYVIKDVLIPGIKDVTSDVLKSAVDQLLFGGTRSNKTGYTSYNTYKGTKSKDYITKQESRQRSAGFAEVYLESRNDALKVIDELQSIVIEYGETSVSDYNSAVGIAGKYTDYNFGWSDLSYLEPIRRREGWIIGLMKPVVL